MTDFADIWTYLAQGPLLWLAATLAAYAIGDAAYRASGKSPLLNAVPVAVVILGLVLWTTGTPYATYFEGAQFVHFLLGTATVALAVPIHQGLKELSGRVIPLVASLLAGGATSIVSAVLVARWLGADPAIIGGFYAKSVTAPIAMGVAERIHVSPTLTAVFAVSTGILGAVLARFVLDAVGSKAWWQRGFAIGVAAHGIGTARAFSVHPDAGRFAGLAMGLHGILGAIVLPLIFR